MTKKPDIDFKKIANDNQIGMAKTIADYLSDKENENDNTPKRETDGSLTQENDLQEKESNKGNKRI